MQREESDYRPAGYAVRSIRFERPPARLPRCFKTGKFCVTLPSPMSKILRLLFYLVSVAAALLWWWSAAVPIPVATFDGLGPRGEFMNALNRSAHLNAWAASTTGVSVALSFVRELLRKG